MQLLRPLALATMGFLVTATAYAHGPTRQKVTDSVTIKAPPAKVWALMGDFGALEKWHPAVRSSPATKGNELESVRNVTLKDGGKLEEKLEKYDAEKMQYSYRLADGSALPVANYTSTISVKPEGGGSKVEWRGAFYRKFMNNNPPPDQNDEAAIKAITGVYKDGLANLKMLLEKGK